MSTYQHNCNGEFRNEGWTLTGSGVTHVNDAWSAIGDDTKFCSNPANKGRACVSFPVDISSNSIADGSNIESVTVFIRAKKTDTSTRSVTVNILCSDDTSHSTQRTLNNLTTTITTQEVATLTRDPSGRPWTRHTLNMLLLQVFSYCGVAAKINIYEAYCIINYRIRPVVKVTAPSGSVDSASPTVSWTYTQADGDPQKFAEYKIFTAAQVAATTFNPDTTPAIYPTGHTRTVHSGDSLFKIAADEYGNGDLWPSIYRASTLRSGDPNLIFPGETVNVPGVAGIVGDITSFTLPFALSQNDYYIYVRATSTRGARSDWANRTFTVVGGVPGIPGGSLGGVGTGGGGGFESVIADGVSSNVFLTLRDGSNLMSVQQSDFETLTDSNGYTATNCTLTQDTTTNYGVGGASLKMVAASAATMSAESTWIEVTPSAPATARAQFRSIVTGRTVNVNILFYDANFVTVGGTINGTGSDVTTTWTEVTCTGTIPATAVYAIVQLQVVSPANAEVHNVDHIGLMYGTNATWSNGGHASRNMLTDTQATADDPVTSEPWVAATASTYSRVAVAGTGSDGSKTFKMVYAGTSPAISFVATGTAFTNTSTGTGYTLNKPAGVADGDVLMAYVASNTGGQAVPPTGWSVVDYTTTASSALTILMRDGLAADPSSWTGNHSTTATRHRAFVVAYRGAAATALQFPPENVASSTGGSLVPTTPAVGNSDPNAWRLSAFAVNDDVTGGTMTANITAPSGPGSISYVGKAGVYKDTNGNLSYTINRPAGVISGDFMVATLGVSDVATVTAPSGWTLVRTTQNTQQGSTHAVLMRTAGGSEPTSWTGSVNHNGFHSLVTQCVAYRGADVSANQFIAESGNTNSSTTINTNSISNNNSGAWRITCFANQTNGGSTTSSNEVSERCDDTTTGTYGINVSMYDSNTTVSTGSHNRSGQSSSWNNLYSNHAWIGLIKPASSAGTPGANETERQDATAGASNPWITLAGYDSNGVAATGNTTVYGSFTPGSGTSDTSWCAWEGFLIPITPTVGGEVGVTLANYVDISMVPADARSRAGNQLAMTASFLGSTAGVPHFKLYSYIGNELISTQVAESDAFNTTVWNKATTLFVLPPGTTRLKLGIAAADRAASDYVLFDRVSVALGSSTVWRNGTGKTAHPILDIPVMQFNEDLGNGYGDWKDLHGTGSSLLKYDPLTGLVTFVDQSVVPLSKRKYRAKTISYGLAGETFISNYGPESNEISLIADDWWLKDLAVPANSMKLRVYNANQAGATGGAGTISVTTTDTSAVFQPLGADKPIVITEGFKGDTIALIIMVRNTEYTQLRDLINARRTLYLQSNIDQSWWVRPNGDLTATTQPTGDMHSNPLKFVTVTFVEVNPEV